MKACRITRFKKWPQFLMVLVFFLGTGSATAADGGYYFVSMPLILRNWDGSPGNITGRISNALDNSPVDGVQVCVDTVCDTSGTHGDPGTYVLANIPWGNQVVNATKSGFAPQTAQVVVSSGQTATLDMIISDDLTAGNVLFRVVLTWRNEKTWPPLGIPNDLDSQLWITGSDPWHIDAGGFKGNCDGRQPNACVEIDTQFGSGPETVDIREFHQDAIYYYGVLNVNVSYPGVPAITRSAARVQVYSPYSTPRTFDVPADGTGDLWYVFKIDTTQNISPTTQDVIPMNCITWAGDLSDPPSCP